jgi:hypothetical protein
LRILVGIGYAEEHDTRVYIANTMTRQMTDRFSIPVIKFIFDNGMLSLAKVPEFLRRNNFQTPEGATKGPFQFAQQIDESMWTWIAKDPEKLDSCNTFMEGDRGARPSWLEWFPVEERLLSGAHPDAETLMVDVAGGRGHDIVAFTERYPHAPGRLVLEDLPHVLEESKIDNRRIEKQPIDLFKPQPVHGKNRTYYLSDYQITDTYVQCRRPNLLHEVYSTRLVRQGESCYSYAAGWRNEARLLEVDHRRVCAGRSRWCYAARDVRLGNDDFL